MSFENAQNQVLSHASLAPVTARARANATELLSRSTKGAVPAGATTALVELRLTTLATDYNGPNGSTVGFNYAYADDIALSLSVPVTAPPTLRPPTATIPHFDHVFLIYL